MNVQDALTRLPNQIRENEARLWGVREQVELLSARVKSIEAAVSYRVADAKDEAGKPRFSNAEKREAATREALDRDAEYAAAQRGLRDERRAAASIEGALAYYRDVQRNARVLVLARSPFELAFDGGEP